MRRIITRTVTTVTTTTWTITWVDEHAAPVLTPAPNPPANNVTVADACPRHDAAQDEAHDEDADQA